MKTYKLIISLILIFAILFSFAGVCFADDPHSSLHPNSFWDWVSWGLFGAGDILQQSGDSYAGIAGVILKMVSQFHSSSPNCLYSPDGLHYSSNWQNAPASEDDYGKYLTLKCDYCGDPFKCYDSELVAQLEQGYNDYITDNNLNNMTADSEGGFYWQPTLEDVDLAQSNSGYYTSVSWDSSYNNRIFKPANPYYNSTWCYLYEHYFVDNVSPNNNGTFGLNQYITYIVPNSNYKYYLTKSHYYDCYIDDGFVDSFNYNESQCIVGNGRIRFNVTSHGYSNNANKVLSFKIYYPLFRVLIPDNAINYNVPQTITVNNITYQVQNFDFSNRSFTVIDDNGDNVTITYGDTEYTIINNTTNITESYNYGSNTEPAVPSGEDNSENWSYLFRWLTAFKQWLGEKLMV